MNADHRKVVQLRPKLAQTAATFQTLTARTVLAQYRNGTLPEAVIVALLAGVGMAS